MKKIFTLILAVAASAGTMNAEIIRRVHIGDLYYNLDTSQETAEVTNQQNSYPYWTTEITSAIIPSSVTYENKTYRVTIIGSDAFHNCNSLVSVEIPNSVTVIDNHAFSYCGNLPSISIPNSVLDIGRWAFINDTSLTSIEIPNSVTRIGKQAFYGCSKLTSAIIPESVTNIEESAFKECPNLTSLTLNSDIVAVDRISYYNPLTSIFGEQVKECIMGDKITAIGDAAFLKFKNLVSVQMPNNAVRIGDYAFDGCSSLTSIEIPNSVTSIESNAFHDCSSLSTVTLSDNLMTIESRAFNNCSQLEAITIPNRVDSIKVEAFGNCYSLTSLTIPNSVKVIEKNAFYFCSRIISLTIGTGLKDLGETAFYGCSRIASITIDNGNTHYDSRNNCNAIIESATNTLVKGCVTTVIPENITGIGNYAFAYCGQINEIEIPETVASIGKAVFTMCGNLKKVTNHASVPQVIDSSVFDKDLSACTLYVPETSVDAYKSADVWKDFNILPIGATEGVNDILPVTSTSKILRDGQLIIEREGKMYTVTGQEVR